MLLLNGGRRLIIGVHIFLKLVDEVVTILIVGDTICCTSHVLVGLLLGFGSLKEFHGLAIETKGVENCLSLKLSAKLMKEDDYKLLVYVSIERGVLEVNDIA